MGTRLLLAAVSLLGVAPCTTLVSRSIPTTLHPVGAPPKACRMNRLPLAAITMKDPAESAAMSRRAALWEATAGVSGALVAFSGGTQHAVAESDAAGNRVVPEDNIEFQAKWTYAKAQDILPYIYATAKEGQVDDILSAMDEFGRHYPMYKLGDEKGKILEREIAQMDPPPKNALELGTFLGYSALRTARRLAPGGKLSCIEYNPDHAETASKVLAYAGLADRVRIIVGDSSKVLPQEAASIGAVDYVLLDHRKNLYLPDLQVLRQH